MEKGKVVRNLDSIKNEEWKNGLWMEQKLHRELYDFAKNDTTFEELFYHMNKQITEKGYVNLDFLGNLGHSIERRSGDRIYIEKGNKKSSAKFLISLSNRTFPKETLSMDINGKTFTIWKRGN